MLLVAAAVFAAAGCSVFYGWIATASCASVDPALVRKAIDGDPKLVVVETIPSNDGVAFRCSRNGVTAFVAASRTTSDIYVSVGGAGPANEAERSAWKQHLDYVCARITSAYPGVGEWHKTDHTGGPPLWPFALGGFVCLSVPAVIAWIVVRALRSPRTPPAK